MKGHNRLPSDRQRFAEQNQLLGWLSKPVLSLDFGFLGKREA